MFSFLHFCLKLRQNKYISKSEKLQLKLRVTEKEKGWQIQLGWVNIKSSTSYLHFANEEKASYINSWPTKVPWTLAHTTHHNLIIKMPETKSINHNHVMGLFECYRWVWRRFGSGALLQNKAVIVHQTVASVTFISRTCSILRAGCLRFHQSEFWAFEILWIRL